MKTRFFLWMWGTSNHIAIWAVRRIPESHWDKLMEEARNEAHR